MVRQHKKQRSASSDIHRQSQYRLSCNCKMKLRVDSDSWTFESIGSLVQSPQILECQCVVKKLQPKKRVELIRNSSSDHEPDWAWPNISRVATANWKDVMIKFRLQYSSKLCRLNRQIKSNKAEALLGRTQIKRWWITRIHFKSSDKHFQNRPFFH